MSFRVTPHTFSLHALQGLQAHSVNLANLQQQASTGRKLLRPSDAPGDVARVLAENARAARFDTDLANMRDAQSMLDQSVSQLLEANRLFVRAKEIAMEGNQTVSFSDKEILAREVDSLLERLIVIANTEDDGRYLFGGTRDDESPFVRVPGPGQVVDYVGSSQRFQIPVGRAVAVDTVFSGAEIFLDSSNSLNAFKALGDLRDDLRNTRGLSGGDLVEAMAQRIADVDRHRENILHFVGEQSIELENLETLRRRAEDLQLEARRVVSELESADIAEVALKLQEEQNLMQFTLASSVAVIQQSILDFLR
jgi:flagellar hook-associated protein 3 FlgL